MPKWIFISFMWITTLWGADAKKTPNIVFIFSDDHALEAISAYGGRFKTLAPTPQIDRIAAQGMIFSKAFCGNSICGPSRASVLTGKHSSMNGFMDNETSFFNSSQMTFPKLLQKAGYQTAVFGKWHLGSKPVGFDTWEIFPPASQGHYYHPIFETAQGTHQEQGYATDLVTDKSLAWLKQRDKTKPFLLMCHHKAVHRCWMPAPRHYGIYQGVTFPEPPTLFDRYEHRSETLKHQEMSIDKNFSWGSDMKMDGENQIPEYFLSTYTDESSTRMDAAERAAWKKVHQAENEQFIKDYRAGKIDRTAAIRWKYQRYMQDYLACTRSLDENVGRVLDFLDQEGLSKDTIVVYSSDQGFYLGEHGWYDKRWMFEESFAMPLLVRWQGHIREKSRCESLVQNIDFAPTFLNLAGLNIPSEIQGKSLLPLLLEKKDTLWRDALYYRFTGEKEHAVPSHEGVRTQRYKLIHFLKTDEWNLFDLEKDPNELKSIYNENDSQEIVKELRSKLFNLKKSYHISKPTEPTSQLSPDWLKQHRQLIQNVQKDQPSVIVIGDDIGVNWEKNQSDLWKKCFQGKQVSNLSMPRERTENIIWRLHQGALPESIQPKVLILMVGKNHLPSWNQGQEQIEETIQGIQYMMDQIRWSFPKVKIILASTAESSSQKPEELVKIKQFQQQMKQLSDHYHCELIDTPISEGNQINTNAAEFISKILSF